METPAFIQPEPVAAKKSKLPIILAIAVVVLLCCCAVAVGVYLYSAQTVSDVVSDLGGYSGRADETLRADALSAIAQYEASQTGCADVSLFSGQLLLSPDQTDDSSWAETWQVTACGASHLYTVRFTPAPGGGTDYSISPADQ